MQHDMQYERGKKVDEHGVLIDGPIQRRSRHSDRRSGERLLPSPHSLELRSTYAVQLLERVKHRFEVPGVVFVFATNSAQLQQSIAGAYGANFAGFRYLKRFL